MTPNDLTEYICHRSRLWEYKYQYNMNKAIEKEELQRFPYRLPDRDFAIDELDPDPPLPAGEKRSDTNPFSNDSNIHFLAHHVHKNDLRTGKDTTPDEDSDLPSSDEEATDHNAIRRRKLKYVSKFNYGVHQPWLKRVSMTKGSFYSHDKSSLSDKNAKLRKLKHSSKLYPSHKSPKKCLSYSQSLSNKLKHKYAMQNRYQARVRGAIENAGAGENEEDGDPKVLSFLKRLEKTSQLTIIRQKLNEVEGRRKKKAEPKPALPKPPKVKRTPEEIKARQEYLKKRKISRIFKNQEAKYEKAKRLAYQKQKEKKRIALGLKRSYPGRSRERIKKDWTKLVEPRKSVRIVKPPVRLANEDSENERVEMRKEESKKVMEDSQKVMYDSDEGEQEMFQTVECDDNTHLEEDAAEQGGSSNQNEYGGFRLGPVQPLSYDPNKNVDPREYIIGLQEGDTHTAHSSGIGKQPSDIVRKGEVEQAGEDDIVQKAMKIAAVSGFSLTAEEPAPQEYVEVEVPASEIVYSSDVIDLEDLPLADRLNMVPVVSKKTEERDSAEMYHVVIMSETDDEKV